MKNIFIYNVTLYKKFNFNIGLNNFNKIYF